MKKQYLSHSVKLLISILLLVILFKSVDLNEIKNVLFSANPCYLILAIGINVLGILLSVYRWRVLLLIQSIVVQFKTLLSISLVAGFFGTFLPSGFGGDIVRGYDLFRMNSNGTGVTASILIERLLGFFSLFTIGSVALFIGGNWVGDKIIPVIIVGYLLLLIVIAALTNKKLINLFPSFFEKFRFLARIKLKINKFLDAVDLYKTDKSTILYLILVSLFLQSIGIIYYFLISLSLSIDVSFWAFFAIMPIVWIATMAPFSIGGIGVKEGVFVVSLSLIQVSSSQALLLSLLGTALYLPFTVIGAVIFLFRKKSRVQNDKPAAASCHTS